jgi:hypothetical protein
LIPLLLFQDDFVALRVANALQVGPLFLVGYWWAHHLEGNRWLIRLPIALFTTAVVLLAVPLGA